MERLTHKTDMGWDAWEEILYSVSYDPEGVYNILDLANEYGIEGQEDCAEILKSISVRLKAYEDTGLEPPPDTWSVRMPVYAYTSLCPVPGLRRLPKGVMIHGIKTSLL